MFFHDEHFLFQRCCIIALEALRGTEVVDCQEVADCQNGSGVVPVLKKWIERSKPKTVK